MEEVWIPRCLERSHTFLGTLYIASAYNDVISKSIVESLETAALRQDVIHLVSEHLTRREECVADHNILAVLQLITGNVIVCMEAGLSFHQNGLQTMIQQRGGLQKLDSTLASMVSWLSLETAILLENQPMTEYLEYCVSQSTKMYPSTLAIPESPIWCPHEDYITLRMSGSCNEQTLQLVVDMRYMIDGLMNKVSFHIVSNFRFISSLKLISRRNQRLEPLSILIFFTRNSLPYIFQCLNGRFPKRLGAKTGDMKRSA